MSSDLEMLEQSFAATAGRYAALRERVTSEISFAQKLCLFHPDRDGEWGPRVERAKAAVLRAAPSGSATELEKAVTEAEEELSLLGPAAKVFTIYCVGHGHIDMNWMWSWPETVAVTNDTFTTVLRLMDEFPQFVYSQSQASVYAILEEHHPELLERIRAKVRDGRWEVTASHWVENDKNIVSSESLCRHVLYTRRYMQDLFGLSPEDVPIDWSPDTFGHAHTVPTYLRRAGIRYYYHHRPGAHGPAARPGAFWWQGPDGSRVLARNDMALGYNGRIAPDIVAKSLLPFHAETGLPFVMYVYGVGDHGGGPTRRDLRWAREMAAWPVFPTVELSTARTFYERLETEGSKLPVLDCELNFEFTGCYTTQTLIKKGNRYAEKKLQDAETAAVLAARAAGRPYPRERLTGAWRDTLFNHFHDILPGSGVMDTRTYAHGLYQRTTATTSQVETQALRAVAALVDTSAARAEPDDLPAQRVPESLGGGAGKGSDNGGLSQVEYRAGTDHRALFLFNPIPVDRTEIVEASVWDTGTDPEPARPEETAFDVTGPDGVVSRAQVMERGAYWGHRFARIAFPARLPALGYGVWVVRETEVGGAPAGGLSRQTGRAHPCHYAIYERGPEGLENDLIRVELDTATGGIRSLRDKRSGLELISSAGPAPALLRFAVERARAMSAWEIEHTGTEGDDVRLLELRRVSPEPLLGRTGQNPLPQVEAWVARIEARYRIRGSEMSLTYEVRDGDPAVYVRIAGTWVERGGKDIGQPALRLAVRLAVAEPVTTYEIPFGAIDRAMDHGEEVPALRWAAVHGKAGGRPGGCLLINDSKHGHSFRGDELSVTLIRSSWEPDPLPEIGRHEARFALVPFAGKLEVRQAVDQARRFEQEIRVLSTDAHTGRLPAAGQMGSVKCGAAVFSALKMSEEGSDVVVRFYNTAPRAEDVTVRMDPSVMGEINEAAEVDLMERPLERSALRLSAGTVSLRVPARGISSVRLKLDPPAGEPPARRRTAR